MADMLKSSEAKFDAKTALFQNCAFFFLRPGGLDLKIRFKNKTEQYCSLNQLWIWLVRECFWFCGKFDISFIFSNWIENSVSDSYTTLVWWKPYGLGKLVIQFAIALQISFRDTESYGRCQLENRYPVIYFQDWLLV